MTQRTKHLYEFGEFRLDVAERALLRSGKPIPLTPKLFDTLVLLVENSGHLVEKDELIKKLWPDAFVEETALTSNISHLRKVLDTTASGRHFIETIPKRGYRFVESVRELWEESDNRLVVKATQSQLILDQQTEVGTEVTLQLEPSPAREGPPELPKLPKLGVRRRRVGLAVLAPATLAVLFSVAVLPRLVPRPIPRLQRMTQVTHSGRVDPWGRLVTDGTRLYFLERDGDHWNPMQMLTGGGEAQPVPAPFRSTRILDLSPDQSEFLMASFIAREEEMPLWSMPAVAGSPRRLGEVAARDAAWSPHGQHVVYSKGQDVYMADRDGSGAKKLVSTSGLPVWFAWSPDGRVLRFSLRDLHSYWWSLWEVSADGSNLHPLLPEWKAPVSACCGGWTPDGSYFLFSSTRGGEWNVFAIREKKDLFHRARGEPVQLTAGPHDFWGVVPGKDRGKIFVPGYEPREELVRYDAGSRQVVPYLPGTNARTASFSRDGQWVAYVVSDATSSVLWRSKVDGSERLQLTFPPTYAGEARLSPDGKQIAFLDVRPGAMPKIYLVSVERATPQELLPEFAQHTQHNLDWSPDGQTIAFAARHSRAALLPSEMAIYLIHLATKRITKVPGSEGFYHPRWSPDARYLAALARINRGNKLMLFDFRAGQWRELDQVAYSTAGEWSRDAKYLYYQDIMEPGEPIYRIRLADRKRERVASFETFLQGSIQRCALVGLMPDGSPVVLLKRNEADIYALDLDLP